MSKQIFDPHGATSPTHTGRRMSSIGRARTLNSNSGDDLTLLCHVEGQSSVFLITISSRNLVCELKAAIKAKNRINLEHIDESDLEIYGVRCSFASA